MPVDVDSRLRNIQQATDRLLGTLRSLNEDDLGEPSLCEGWTRGHVLAHIALNADSLVNLFNWARTGIETPQYPSWERRNADIELHSKRSIDEHLSAIAAASERLMAAATAVPAGRWELALVAGVGAAPQPASNYLQARRREVEVHHVDLDAGYGPQHWPQDFVDEELSHAAERFSSRDVAESFEYEDTVSGRVWSIGNDPSVRVRGAGSDLLSWLMGRSNGERLQTTGTRVLPVVGPWG